MTVELIGKLIDGIHYIIYIKTPDELTHAYQSNDRTEAKASSSYTVQVSLADLHNPPILSFSALTRQDVTLDSSAWDFDLLDYSPAPAAMAIP